MKACIKVQLAVLKKETPDTVALVRIIKNPVS